MIGLVIRLFEELKRRNVLRMAVLYLGSAWFVVEAVDVLGDILIWPLWTSQVALAVLVVGFPIALLISWFYEVTPAGVRREEEEPTPAAAAEPRGRAVDFIIISLLCAAVLVFAYDKWWPQAPVERAIVVRPFENLSGDPEDAYFSDGIADDTRNLLADIKSFKVIAWATARMFEGAEIAKIATELNVSHVLDGTVRKSGNRVRVTVELIDSTDNSVVWSEPFERELTAENLFEIQQEIATAIAARLRASLTRDERERLETVPTNSFEAYDAYLLGKQGIARATTASLLDAAEHLRHAIELDPMYAEAYVALAEAYWDYEVTTFGRLPEGVTENTVGSLISRALELGPALGFAHAMHGKWLARQGEPGADAEFTKAIELSPNDPDVYRLYGGFVDDREQGLGLYREGLRLDPRSPSLLSATGMQLGELGRPDEAVAQYERAIESDPDSFWGYWGLGVTNWYFSGRIDEAMRWLRIAYSKDPGNINNICLIGWTYLFLNDDVTAERWFRHAMSEAPRDFFAKSGLFDVYQVRGHDDQMRAILNELPGGGYLREFGYLIKTARYEEALEAAKIEFPGFFERDESAVTDYRGVTNTEALDLLLRDSWIAMILRGLGDNERAEEILKHAESYIDGKMVLGAWDYSIHALVYAAIGRNSDAIRALRKMIDAGAYGFWQQVLLEAQFDAIRESAEFQQIRKDIEAEMAIQLERVREMERNGELAMLPEES